MNLSMTGKYQDVNLCVSLTINCTICRLVICSLQPCTKSTDGPINYYIEIENSNRGSTTTVSTLAAYDRSE